MSVPVPVLVNDPLSWITPEKVVLWLLLPIVSAFVPRNTKPSPETEPIVTPLKCVSLMSNSPLPKSEMLAVPPPEWPPKVTSPPSEPLDPVIGSNIGIRGCGATAENQRRAG